MPHEPSTPKRNPADEAAFAAAADPALAHARAAALRPEPVLGASSFLDALTAAATEEEPERWDGLS